MSGADAVLPDGERSEPASDVQGRVSVTRAAWRLLGAALISQIGISVVEQGIPVLTGFIKTDLGVSAAAAGLTVSAFTVGRALGSYAAGVAADQVGERRVLIGGGLATARSSRSQSRRRSRR